MRNFFLNIPGIKEFYLFVKEKIIYSLEKKKWNKLKKQSKIKLDLGSNKRGTNGFVTIDYMSGDIRHNLFNPLPLENSTVDQIYTSHTLEHFKFENILFIIKECNRVLKPDGKLKICVPNSRFYIDSYLKRENFIKRKNWYAPAVTETGSHIDQLNYIAYLNGQHKFMFDEQNLTSIIKMCGFKEVSLRNFEEDLDLQERDYESIYALGVK